MTQARASTTLDLPDPLGPTMHVMPGSRRIVVAEAKDLKPLRVTVLTYTVWRVGFLVGGGPGGPRRVGARGPGPWRGSAFTVPAGAGGAGDGERGTPRLVRV